jgi:phosphoglycolate phosphatase-like HAD superfamily hydrolase
MIVVVDLDHTVSDAFWRDSMIGVNPWDEYYENAKYDKPFKNVANLINSLSAMNYEIIAFTGRPEKFRTLTVSWLVRNRIDIDIILMRPDGDFTKNSDLKLKLIKEYFKDRFYQIHFIIDDNEESVLEFYKLGIPTLQIRNVRPKDLFA